MKTKEHVLAFQEGVGFGIASLDASSEEAQALREALPGIDPTLEPLIGARLDTKLIFQHWENLLRLATSIKQATVTASTILRKLAAHPRQN